MTHLDRKTAVVGGLCLALFAWPMTPASAEDDGTAQLISQLKLQMEQLQERVRSLEAQLARQPLVAGGQAASYGQEPRIAQAVYQRASMPAPGGAGVASPVTAQEAPAQELGGETPAADLDDFFEEPVFDQAIDIFSEHDVQYGSPTSFLEWHGYLAFEFDDEQGQNSNFDNHEFYLSATASVSEKLSFTAEMEFEHTPEKLLLPIQAFGRYRIAEDHALRAGIFFVPIGIPRSYTLRGNTNMLIRQVALTHDIMFENWSVVGLGGYGNLFKLDDDNQITYDVAISNGLRGMATGDSWADAIDSLVDHTQDNNNNKLLSGRVGWASHDVFGGKLNLGASYATQQYSADDEPRRDMTHFGLDFRYIGNNGWRIQSEWLDRGGDDNPVDLANGIGADAFGWYFQLAKRIKPGKAWLNYLDFVVQVDEIDLNRDTDTNGDRRTLALGLNYSPEPFFILKWEYDFVEEVNGMDLDNDKLWFSVVYEF